jgi:hypothetical protein
MNVRDILLPQSYIGGAFISHSTIGHGLHGATASNFGRERKQWLAAADLGGVIILICAAYYMGSMAAFVLQLPLAG